MKKFLTFKHWQLFLLLIGIPIIIQFVSFSTIIATHDPKTTFYFFPVMMVISFGFIFSWLYTLGTNLHKKLPKGARMNLTTFKVFLFVPASYMFLISVFMVSMFSNLSLNQPLNPFIFILVFPIHLFSMFCIFYCLYFNAKALKIIELQRPVMFSDFAGEFFLLWFFPIGIWMIQPRINKLFVDTDIANNQMIPDGSF